MSEHATRNDNASISRKAKARENSLGLQADAIKALAHPKRLVIVQALSDGKEWNVTDLQKLLRIRQSNVSQNLAVLREAGLVTTRREGNVVYYRIRDSRVAKAVELIAAVARDAAEDPLQSQAIHDAKTKQAAKRNTLIGASMILALTSLLALAALHPIINGGTMTDVIHHVKVLAASPDVTTMAANCRDAVTSTPTPSVASIPARMGSM